MACNEKIVLIPVTKGECFWMERVEDKSVNESEALHVAGGSNAGIVIQKQSTADQMTADAQFPHVVLEFTVYLTDLSASQLTDHSSDLLTPESRKLSFWFKEGVDESEKMKTAQRFFKELVQPASFPRDYVQFIKKILKQMQAYTSLRRVELKLVRSSERVAMPATLDSDRESTASPNIQEITPERLLDLVERAYPNSISVENIQHLTNNNDETTILELLEVMRRQRIIKQLENGTFLRAVHNEAEIHMVKQMPKVSIEQQPTIAVITSLYCEKLAMDAMLENAKTYVRYKTEGEANVYTVGDCGQHRVVTTKLPAVGHSRTEMIAAGNTTTRLLGTFQQVEFVFVVGVGGGVPHYTDWSQHVRLGDCVVSAPSATTSANSNLQSEEVQRPQPIYIYVEDVEDRDGEKIVGSYNRKCWSPSSYLIQDVARSLVVENDQSWLDFMQEAEKKLGEKEESLDTKRPPAETDKLFMPLGGKEVIEVSHPLPAPAAAAADGLGSNLNQPRIHFGSIASGRSILKDSAKNDFAHNFGICAFDNDFDAVADSVFGNRKDCYAFVRGIADYHNGQKGKEWQPYAALVAAALTKSIIIRLPDVCEEDATQVT